MSPAYTGDAEASNQINPEYGQLMDSSLEMAAHFDFSVTEIRLWNQMTKDCTWESLVRGMTGWSPADGTLSDTTAWAHSQDDPMDASNPDEMVIDEPVVHDIIEMTLSMFPDVRRIRNCRTDHLWSRRHTMDLIEDVHRDRVIVS